ncbi:MAG: SEC-C domain-containing protein [Candidatus Brocadiae bacterium]|nr:SEC-C domain-containing protein [Candidatus Brocadiia bacterium]
MELGRNDPCWCGSGKKYKKCHMHRQTTEPLSRQEVLGRFKRATTKRYCLHPESGPGACSATIARSHTIPKAALRQIADRGHVRQIGVELFPAGGTNGLAPVQDVGLNDASTFTGFCSRHDNDTFEPIEKHAFQSSQEHAFLVAYRTLCCEVFKKRIHADVTPNLRESDRGRSLDEQIAIQREVNQYQQQVDTGLRELERHKARYDGLLTTEDYAPVRFYVAHLASCPEIMCSGGITPECDFHGRQLHDITDITLEQDYLAYSLFGTQAGGIAVFAWLDGGTGTCRGLVSSLHALDDHELPDALVRFTFEFHENTFLASSWWDGLTDRKGRALRKRAGRGRSRDPIRPSGALRDDGLGFVSWQVTSRDTNAAGL